MKAPPILKRKLKLTFFLFFNRIVLYAPIVKTTWVIVFFSESLKMVGGISKMNEGDFFILDRHWDFSSVQHLPHCVALRNLQSCYLAKPWAFVVNRANMKTSKVLFWALVSGFWVFAKCPTLLRESGVSARPIPLHVEIFHSKVESCTSFLEHRLPLHCKAQKIRENVRLLMISEQHAHKWKHQPQTQLFYPGILFLFVTITIKLMRFFLALGAGQQCMKHASVHLRCVRRQSSVTSCSERIRSELDLIFKIVVILPIDFIIVVFVFV